MDIGKELRVIEVEEPRIDQLEEDAPEVVEIAGGQPDVDSKTG